MFLKRPSSSVMGILLAAAWAFVTPGAFGQSADVDEGEVSARGGVGFGGGASGIGTQAMGAGSTGLAFSRYGMALFETSFMPLGQHTIQGWPAGSTVDRSYLLDFGVDIHILFPTKTRVTPYAIAGTGLMWNMVRQTTVDASGAPLVKHYDQLNGALHTGGGLRYKLGEKWGIRSEVKVTVSKQVYTCLSFGVYYVLPANWP
jgi:hypothetical protein